MIDINVQADTTRWYNPCVRSSTTVLQLNKGD